MTNAVSGDPLTALVEQAKRDEWAHIGEAETAHLHGNAQSEGLHRALAQVHHWFAVEIEKADALIAAGRSAATTEQKLINDLYTLFTSTPAEIAATFGESRCKDDHDRINYALEWIQDFVTDPAPAPLPAPTAAQESELSWDDLHHGPLTATEGFRRHAKEIAKQFEQGILGAPLPAPAPPPAPTPEED